MSSQPEKLSFKQFSILFSCSFKLLAPSISEFSPKAPVIDEVSFVFVSDGKVSAYCFNCDKRSLQSDCFDINSLSTLSTDNSALLVPPNCELLFPSDLATALMLSAILELSVMVEFRKSPGNDEAMSLWNTCCMGFCVWWDSDSLLTLILAVLIKLTKKIELSRMTSHNLAVHLERECTAENRHSFAVLAFSLTSSIWCSIVIFWLTPANKPSGIYHHP